MAFDSHPLFSLVSDISFLPLALLSPIVLFFHFVYCLGLLVTIIVVEIQYKHFTYYKVCYLI